MSEQETKTKDTLDHKVIIMHGFSYEEINRIMKVVKQQFDTPRDLVFAKTTDTSLTMVLKDLIEDMCEDHESLKRNPPTLSGDRAASQPGSADTPGDSN